MYYKTVLRHRIQPQRDRKVDQLSLILTDETVL